MTPTRQGMLDSLPICDGDLTIRQRTRTDLDEYAAWPLYPHPFESFSETFGLRYAAMTAEQRDERFKELSESPATVPLAIDRETEVCVANLTLREIDWASGMICNMGFLVKPTMVGKGIGTRIMNTVTDWCFGHGFTSIRFDVVACNTRAVRCYEKAGYKIVGEFWKDEEPLRGKDIALPEYDFMRPHVRVIDGNPQIRFWWMERSRG